MPTTDTELKLLIAAAALSFLTHATLGTRVLIMPAITLKAHYDGEQVRLDEPFEIPPNSALMVTILPSTEAIVGNDWIVAARTALSAAYGADEPEYGTDDLHRP